MAAIADGQYGRLAGYTYAGSSRRVGSEFGPLTAAVIQQTFAGGTGYSGLDRFGRIKDLHYKDAAGATIHPYEYSYDKAGNP